MPLDQTQDSQIWGTMTPSYWVAWILSIQVWVKSPRERDFPAGNLISRPKQSRLQDCVGVCVHGYVAVHAHLCVCSCIPMETRGQPQLLLLKRQLPCILGWVYWQCPNQIPRYFHRHVGTCTGWKNLESPYLHSLRCRCQGCPMTSGFHTSTERSRMCSLHLVNRLPKVDVLTLVHEDCMEVQLWYLLTDGLWKITWTFLKLVLSFVK